MYLHEIMLIWTNIGFKCFDGICYKRGSGLPWPEHIIAGWKLIQKRPDDSLYFSHS